MRQPGNDPQSARSARLLGLPASPVSDTGQVSGSVTIGSLSIGGVVMPIQNMAANPVINVGVLTIAHATSAVHNCP
jgi:hypothetical protein